MAQGWFQRHPERLILIVSIVAIVLSLFLFMGAFFAGFAAGAASFGQGSGGSAQRGVSTPTELTVESAEATADLKAVIKNDLNDLSRGTDADVTSLKVTGTSGVSQNENGAYTAELYATATVWYGAESKDVDVTIDYVFDPSDGLWYIYDYRLSDYSVFPAGLQEYVEQGKGTFREYMKKQYLAAKSAFGEKTIV